MHEMEIYGEHFFTLDLVYFEGPPRQIVHCTLPVWAFYLNGILRSFNRSGSLMWLDVVYQACQVNVCVGSRE
jgi:hypothetical protein